MKIQIRKTILLIVVDIFAWNILKLLFKTIKFKIENQEIITDNKRFILSFYHRHLLIPLYVLKNRNITALVSDHTDGEIIARIIKKTGNNTARGSSTRGFIKGIKQLIKISQTDNIAITPDGPKGPVYTLQDGLIFLAKKTGFPIIGIAGNFNKKIVFNSWDNFILPLPFSKSYIKYSNPIYYNNNISFKENKILIRQHLISLADETSTKFPLQRNEKQWKSISAKYKYIFYILSFIYKLFISIKNLLYNCKLFKSNNYPNIKIVSFGNITVGGTGKTQMLEHYADTISNKKNIIILTGGYKSKCSVLTVVKKDTAPKYCGDEALMLKNNIPDAIVISSNNKRKAIEIINKNFKNRTLLIDDGFHYRNINYNNSNNENLLIIDAATDIFHEKILPSGKLREPLNEIKRATGIFINKSEFTDDKLLSELINKLLKINSNADYYKTEYRIEKIYNIIDNNLILQNITEKNYAVATGIGNPIFFIKLLEKNGLIINHKLFFNDHADYNIDEIALIKKLYDKCDYILITEKDAVKLKNKTDYLNTDKIYIVKSKIKYHYINSGCYYFLSYDNRKNC